MKTNSEWDKDYKNDDRELSNRGESVGNLVVGLVLGLILILLIASIC